MARYLYVYVNHAYLYNWSLSSCYLTTTVLNDCYSEVMAYTALAYSYWAIVSATRMDAKAIPTNNTNYSYHLKTIELI